MRLITTILLYLIVPLAFGSTNGINGPRKPVDTLNQVDSDKLKQGYWIFYGKDKRLPDYELEQKVEEGRYIDNRKDGIWTKYYPSGRIQNEITYKNSRPNGLVKVYFPNGKLKEEGIWKGNKWSGVYKLYFENGSPRYSRDGDIFKTYFQDSYGKILEHFQVLRDANGKVNAKVLLNMDGLALDTILVDSFRPYPFDDDYAIIEGKWDGQQPPIQQYWPRVK